MMMKFLLLFLIVFSLIPKEVQAAPSCGKLVNSLMKYDPAKKSCSFEIFYFSEEEFCDTGTKEINANFDVHLIDQEGKSQNLKSLYLSTLTVIEPLKSKAGEFGKNKVLLTPQFRNVKFSLMGNKASVVSYKIVFKTDQKICGEGVIKWQ